MSSCGKVTPAPRTALDPEGEAVFDGLARDLRLAHRSPKTIEAYRLSLEHLRATVTPDTPLLAMTRAQISGFLLALGDVHYQSASSIDTHYRHLRRFYNYCVEEQELTASPMTRIPAPVLPRPVTPVLTDDQLRAIVAACATPASAAPCRPRFAELRDTAMVRLLCEAGAPRAAELCGITTTDLDMTADRVLLHGKGRKDRMIAFGNATGKALSRYLRERARRPGADRCPLVFLGIIDGPAGPRGLTPSGLLQIIKARGAQAGIPGLHPHQFRHTAYDRWDRAGGSRDAAEQLFGWSGPAMTRIYGAAAAGHRAVTHAQALAIGDTL